MEIIKYTLGNLRSNCYILRHGTQCVVIDPGYESDDIFSYIKTHDLVVQAIYITHGHYDHIGGVNQLKSHVDAPIYAPKKDAMFFEVGPYNKLGFNVFVDVWVSEGDQFSWLDQIFKVIETPGHSPGGTVLVAPDCLFSGDTLFFQSIGRTDIPLSSSQHIYQSIKRIYQDFDDDMMVYPGHGKSTTIGHEKKYNPFVRA